MIKKIGIFLLITTYFLIAYALFYHYDISCVFLHFTGIPCPGCGMTRAFISLISMNFLKAIEYNVVIFFMPYIFAYLFFGFKKRIHNTLLILIASTAIVNWIIKIILFI